jgi:hypothetical protein
MDDLATRGGPVMVKPASTWFWGNLGTDSRKSVQVGFNVNGFRAEKGLSSSYRIGLWSTLRPASNVQIDLQPSYRTARDFAQWIKNENAGGVDHYVFGELNSRVLDMTARATVSLTPDLSFQMYLQSFVAVGDYGTTRELAQPASYRFTPYALTDNPDFNRRSLRSNMVLRWEYRPGSTLFLVWAQSRSAFSSDPTFRPFQSLSNSFTDSGQNIFQIKMNYWFNL